MSMVLLGPAQFIAFTTTWHSFDIINFLLRIHLDSAEIFSGEMYLNKLPLLTALNSKWYEIIQIENFMFEIAHLDIKFELFIFSASHFLQHPNVQIYTFRFAIRCNRVFIFAEERADVQELKPIWFLWIFI